MDALFSPIATFLDVSQPSVLLTITHHDDIHLFIVLGNYSRQPLFLLLLFVKLLNERVTLVADSPIPGMFLEIFHPKFEFKVVHMLIVLPQELVEHLLYRL
jgi:hypothetical protein